MRSNSGLPVHFPYDTNAKATHPNSETGSPSKTHGVVPEDGNSCNSKAPFHKKLVCFPDLPFFSLPPTSLPITSRSSSTPALVQCLLAALPAGATGFKQRMPSWSSSLTTLPHHHCAHCLLVISPEKKGSIGNFLNRRRELGHIIDTFLLQLRPPCFILPSV